MNTSSILTNSSALTALQSLDQTEQALSSTQNEISTGLAVSSAADNAAYWSIATTMRSDNTMGPMHLESMTIPPYAVYIGELRY